ncbi:MAG: hypothetical protein IKM97_02050 [Clostridia bacterium]|nr:hypothetical protein [Clostridia bacterium]
MNIFLTNNKKLYKRKINFKTIYISILFIIFTFSYPKLIFSADPKLISTLNNAFEKLESYLVKLSTPAAAVAVGTGVFMKKFSFGDEEKIRTAKRIIRGSLFSYGFILCIDLVLALMKTLLS